MKNVNKLHEIGNIQSSFDYFMRFNIPKNAKILDVGCNYGSLIYNLYKKGYKNVYGIDINRDSINQGKKSYKKIKNRLSTYNGKKIPFKDNSFDVVLMFDVIEHIPNAQDFLKDEIYRVLKKEGIFIFQTPNKIINIPWEIVKKGSLIAWRKDHCSLQTYWVLRKLLVNSNFRDIKIEKYNIYTKPNINKLSKNFGFLTSKIILKLLSKFPIRLYSNFWGSCRK